MLLSAWQLLFSRRASGVVVVLFAAGCAASIAMLNSFAGRRTAQLESTHPGTGTGKPS